MQDIVDEKTLAAPSPSPKPSLDLPNPHARSRSHSHPETQPHSERLPWGGDYVAQQPTATLGMSLSGGNRNVKNLPRDGLDGSRAWSHDLLDSVSQPKTFFSSLFCPCVVHTTNKQRLRNLEEKGYPLPDEWRECCTVECTGFGLFSLICCCFTLQMDGRKDVRERYEITGSTSSDCATSAFCLPCALTQEARELELEEETCSPVDPTQLAIDAADRPFKPERQKDEVTACCCGMMDMCCWTACPICL
ncbi:PLAC8-domain-containing protein [Punctularia strigosozonata HHB-11173 SS5]|uniref:PLAC8-domain-containing protein n=1 Tax=Punctularia strigosozonata (strain HHB-11173) TaxID=741275 RepID=UPI0004417674|nr:PLAC8-domain-containing protein [Punctularia strigosozonata HHB-11173 SS5]EIN07649.1 PLAC8-domain-containing protein [Punctularia strigosozonata HHB-11173 SS5]